MKKLISLTVITLLFTSSTPSQPRARMFEVRVEAKINSCISRHDVMVEARNIQDARDKARRVVQHRLSIKAVHIKETKQP